MAVLAYPLSSPSSLFLKSPPLDFLARIRYYKVGGEEVWLR